MDTQSGQTVEKYRRVLKPLLKALGQRPLAELIAKQVR